ncbi:bifunctional murein DD-endopeptidase/murein LD-carboxypeptidase [Ancylomarina euxinus]|uniref:Bifunctional murein DD-endopeptidase/murein LD-carboxypeptidase n=1 Tax=Ancylomarina euxinus TaxID=2283627 RepID=A0A425Y2D4_9BACT|nr:NlpC/P60 family protein [Ancylomarina euxinus]MCZ4695038.1 NlpC/P60 family protein [Ancylomarina euxinus]MUP15026.1 bifunctional murein DD-endopeptidase/murein LD-carboxypeptidase [Ancylomarina euxinus]RRG21913.1 bifunctional murein DD-endopeptidase/murein LD-carboxypeptidase [Ancylomarina euxinus]
MIRKILSLTIIAFTIASCSTSERVIKQDTSIDGLKRSKKRISLKDKLEKEYQNYKGVPYKYGGTTYKGFDCSGFVQSTYKKALNINLPRSTREMQKKGIVVPKSKLRIGDLVFFKPRNTYRHVGIFMGNNMFIHVSSSRGVIKSSLKEDYWMKYYFQSRRVF